MLLTQDENNSVPRRRIRKDFMSLEEKEYLEWLDKGMVEKFKSLFPSKEEIFRKRPMPEKETVVWFLQTWSQRWFFVIFFWYILIAEVYVMLGFAIPYNHSSRAGYFQVFGALLALQTVVNWFCVRFTKCDSPGTICFENKPSGHFNGAIQTDQCKPLEKAHLPNPDIQHSVSVNLAAEDTQEVDISRKYCSTCKADIPFRAHHCAVCDVCVLKRDHHCIFTGTCIGYYNQKYFVIMCFYITAGSLWGWCETTSYIYYDFLAESWLDYFVPWAMVQCITGRVALSHVLALTLVYALLIPGVMGLVIFIWQMVIIPQGKTSHEVMKKIPISRIDSYGERYRDVFGRFWPVNFLFPVWSQTGNGVDWNSVHVSGTRNM